MNLMDTSNPFPGMNPYLENTRIWPDVHNTLIGTIRRQLNQNLPVQYYAEIEERLIVEFDDESRNIVPDISLTYSPLLSRNPTRFGGATVLEREQTSRTLTLPCRQPLEESRETYLTIRETRGRRDVVAIVEVLSPSNKTAGNTRFSYQQKQWEIINSSVNLIEIDLLRAGEHTVYPHADAIHSQFGGWDYLVCLSRYLRRDVVDLWLMSLRDPLPKVTVPLKEGDAEVTFDLQEALDQAYIEGAYIRILDYDEPPPPPAFSVDDASWIKETIGKSAEKSQRLITGALIRSKE